MQREGCNHDAKLQHCDVHHTMCALLRPQGQITDCSMRLDRARQAHAKVTMPQPFASPPRNLSCARACLRLLDVRNYVASSAGPRTARDMVLTRATFQPARLALKTVVEENIPPTVHGCLVAYHTTAPTVRSVDGTAFVFVRRRARCRLVLCTCNVSCCAARAGVHACLCVGVCTCPRHLFLATLLSRRRVAPSSRHARCVADSVHGSLHRLVCCSCCIEQVRLRPLARARGTLHRRRRGAAQLRCPLPGVFVAWFHRQWQCAAAAGVAHVVEWFRLDADIDTLTLNRGGRRSGRLYVRARLVAQGAV
jgi:hypothetical protein